MRQAIVCRYRGPTQHQGARIHVSASAGSVSVPWDHDLDRDPNYCAAARVLAVRLQWTGTYVGGSLPDGRYVFVHVPTTEDTKAASSFTVPEDV